MLTGGHAFVPCIRAISRFWRIFRRNSCGLFTANMDKCPFCEEDVENGMETVSLGQKGCDRIDEASQSRGNNSLRVFVGQRVHVNCRKRYTDKKDISIHSNRNKREACVEKRRLRSEGFFHFADHCVFCGTLTEQSSKKGGENDVFPVRTSDFQRTILNVCCERGDAWADSVRGRIEFAQDLHAADAIYHQACSVNFRTGLQIPSAYVNPGQAKRPRSGRPSDVRKDEAFNQVIEFLRQNDEEQITVGDLVSKMAEILGDDVEPYSAKYMRSKLLDHQGDDIIITNISGRADVVTIRTTAAKILQKFYDSPRTNDPETEKMKIIKAAAEFIESDIKSQQTSLDVYPHPDHISSLEKNLNFLPHSLRNFLGSLFRDKKRKLRIASVGQSIMQGTRPRVIMAPLQLGLGVQMHHHFASKFLIDTLHSHGFSCSYNEVVRFESCAANAQGFEIRGLSPGHFIQYVADNVDHNVRTLDGHDTYHGMGMIAAVTPSTTSRCQVKRTLVSASEGPAASRIAIRYYKGMVNKTSIVYSHLPVLCENDPTWRVDLLWEVAFPLRKLRPGYSGMMQAVSKGPNPGNSSVTFLPMIDMPPTDLSCVYTTLHFVADMCRKQGKTPILTFDQPLYWKARLIQANEQTDSALSSIVLRLGGFHTEMSFLGSIGHAMTFSGLQEALQSIYAEQTVAHMLSGKALARAVRGHFIVYSALMAILVSSSYGTSLNLGEDDTDGTDNGGTEASHPTDVMPEDLLDCLELYDALMNDVTDVTNVCSQQCIDRVFIQLRDKKEEMSANSESARLWFQYMEMIQVLRLFIKAERTGNWKMHLRSLQEMLPYMAATGHTLYAKSIHVYLQDMLRLEHEHPDVYVFFESGYHVIRRSDRYWGGLSTDLVIEQVLMRSIKSTGGLTRGRGMEEAQRIRWLESMPACADINAAMQEVADSAYVTSDQHREATCARRSRDSKDTEKVTQFLFDHQVFNGPLRNVANGVHADSSVNAHHALDVGSRIISSMSGENAAEYVFRKKDQVITLGHKVSVQLGEEMVNVDSQLLFQRLISIASCSQENIDELFAYELCAYPPALFDDRGLMLEANKALLADAMWKVSQGAALSQSLPERSLSCHVIDGGSLLHRLPWKRGSSFDDICRMYVDHIRRNYSQPVIVFDGYESGPSTKDSTHLRRTKNIVGARVNFVGSMPLTMKKEHFLANKENKQQFISVLSDRLRLEGIQVIQADADADLPITLAALDCAKQKPTFVIGEDTDILILLCHHTKERPHGIYFLSAKSTCSRVWDIDATVRSLGPETCHLLPFVHALCGCDTTSRLFGVSKATALKKVVNDAYFRQQALVFCSEASRQDLEDAGKRAVVSLYGGDQATDLDALRARRFKEKASTGKTCVELRSLPPTSQAVKFHCDRVYHQVQTWMGTGDSLDPEEWGWRRVGNRLEPVMSKAPAAPQKLLHVVRCQCKGDCDSKRCSCRKHGLECSEACSECRGSACSNSKVEFTETEMEDPEY